MRLWKTIAAALALLHAAAASAAPFVLAPAVAVEAEDFTIENGWRFSRSLSRRRRPRLHSSSCPGIELHTL